MDIEITTDFDSVARDLEALIDSYGFDIAGVAGKSLADDMVNAVAESISEDCRNGIAPDGSNWAKNSDNPEGHGYASWKARRFGVHDPGYRTGETLSIKALVGEVKISNTEIVQSHGTGAVDEFGATDKQKGDWLTSPKEGRAARPFYSFNEARADKVVEVAANGLERHLGGG